MKKILLVLFLSLLSSMSFAGGGWVYKQGQGYLKLTQWWAVSPSSFDAFGNRTSLVPVGYFNTSIYGEVGLSDKLTGTLYMPFYSRMVLYQRNSDPLVPTESLNGFGDVDISFKYGLITDQTFVASASLTLGIPFGRTGQGVNENLATGDGELNVMFRLDGGFGWNISSLQGWGNAYVAYNNRSLTFNDEFRFGAELGAKVWKNRLLLIGRLDRIDALGEFEANAGTIFSNNFEFLSVSGEVGINFTEKIGIAGTVTKALSGRSYFTSPSYAVGIYMNI
ncbi:MAG: hypothetical protein MRZ79_11055 [Bacteroidia bacterium]|nr:hypothetical protein [Bacteroidia bacterium]